jgi:hypothetical protein
MPRRSARAQFTLGASRKPTAMYARTTSGADAALAPSGGNVLRVGSFEIC